jgi:hypothetical protein
MSDGTVQISQDNLSKNQWGKNFFLLDYFYKQSGSKKELDRKKAIIALAFGCTVLLILQVILDPDAGSVTIKSAISGPSDIGLVETVEIPVVPQSELMKVSTSSKRGSTLKLSGPQVVARPKDLKAIPPGTMLSAILRSGASNGLVKAEATENLRVNGDTIIEKGSTFVGQGSSGDDRLSVSFGQVVFKDGTFGQVNAVACDNSDKIVGLKGSKVGNKALNIAGSLGLGFLGGFSTALQDTRGQQGVAIAEPSMKNALLMGTASAALQESQNLMSEVKNQPNIIEIPNSTPICLLFGESR